VAGRNCPKGGLREYLLAQGLSDRQFIEKLSDFGLPDLAVKFPSYRAVLCEIKKRGTFPANKPTSHGGRMLAAWEASLGKRKLDSFVDRVTDRHATQATQPTVDSRPAFANHQHEPSLESTPTILTDQHDSKRLQLDILELELSACVSNFQQRSVNKKKFKFPLCLLVHMTLSPTRTVVGS
jgi:hypothetical protein